MVARRNHVKEKGCNMGEYFRWVNISKREYLCPNDFDCGNKFYESGHKRDPVMRALHELLSFRWKGDAIVFLGDEGQILPDAHYGILRELDMQAKSDDYFDYICENYRNISCLFRETEKVVREEIEDYLEADQKGCPHEQVNQYGIEIHDPFAGLFAMKGRNFRYTVNHTKKEYYSSEEIRVYHESGYSYEYLDPLPVLMGYGRSVKPGLWLDDTIGVSDEVDSKYSFLSEICLKDDGSIMVPRNQDARHMRKIACDWQREFTPLILARGKKYFEEGRVGRVQSDGETYVASVEGTERYEVEITLDGERIEEMDCSCPYAERDNCKHMAAVLFALESEKLAIEELPPVKKPPIISRVPVEMPWLEAIDNLPEAVIRRELLKQVERDEQLKERLAFLYLGKLPEYQLQNWKADLQTIAEDHADRRGRIGCDDVWEFLNDLGNFLESKLPALLEIKAVMDAFHLVWLVMETALEWPVDDPNDEMGFLFVDCEEALRKIFPMATQTQRERMQQWYQEHRNEEWPGDMVYMDYIFKNLTQPELPNIGKRYVKYIDDVPCFLCEGEWISFPKRHHLYYDFVEDTAAYQEAVPVIEEIIKENLDEMYGSFGSCHTIWRQRKQLLMEKYGIEWFSPAQLNRAVCFD